MEDGLADGGLLGFGKRKPEFRLRCSRMIRRGRGNHVECEIWNLGAEHVVIRIDCKMWIHSSFCVVRKTFVIGIEIINSAMWIGGKALVPAVRAMVAWRWGCIQEVYVAVGNEMAVFSISGVG